MIISDFLDKRGYEPALRYLLARNMDIYVIQVMAREEVEPELVGDLRLVDAEDEDVAEITVSAPLLRPFSFWRIPGFTKPTSPASLPTIPA